jgi:hypothetical protein
MATALEQGNYVGCPGTTETRKAHTQRNSMFQNMLHPPKMVYVTLSEEIKWL